MIEQRDIGKFGKLPKTKEHSVKFKNYLPSKLPPLPASYGYMLPNCGMLGNDQYGDCVIAGILHNVMLAAKTVGKTITFQTQDALNMYSAITGFNPNDPNSDQGTVMMDAINYIVKNGVYGHKVLGFAELTPGNIEELHYAIYLFGGALIGVNLPQSAETQFSENKAWIDTGDTNIIGGHGILESVYSNDFLNTITWGTDQLTQDEWFKRYNDEGYVILFEDMLNEKHLATNGFDLDTLLNDLKQL